MIIDSDYGGRNGKTMMFYRCERLYFSYRAIQNSPNGIIGVRAKISRKPLPKKEDDLVFTESYKIPDSKTIYCSVVNKPHNISSLRAGFFCFEPA